MQILLSVLLNFYDHNTQISPHLKIEHFVNIKKVSSLSWSPPYIFSNQAHKIREFSKLIHTIKNLAWDVCKIPGRWDHQCWLLPALMVKKVPNRHLFHCMICKMTLTRITFMFLQRKSPPACFYTQSLWSRYCWFYIFLCWALWWYP